VDYDTAWARRYPVRLMRAVVVDNVARPLAHAVASPEVRGDELLSLVETPVILVANHTSHLDTALLISVLPPRLRHATIVAGAADYFFDRRWKAHLWAFLTAAIPIERQRVNRKSADLAAEMLEDGWNLLIYPEGGRSPDGWMQTFRPGAAYLAVRTRRPVVPVHLEGTFKVMARGGGKVRRSPTTVTFGLPIAPEPDEDARSFGRRIEAAVHLLATERATDWWTARKLAARGVTSEAGGPDASAWRRSWALGPSPRETETSEEHEWALHRNRVKRSK
jgi:1-acyl-sn-glycerol-3-phosphate acyltransferase